MLCGFDVEISNLTKVKTKNNIHGKLVILGIPKLRVKRVPDAGEYRNCSVMLKVI